MNQGANSDLRIICSLGISLDLIDNPLSSNFHCALLVYVYSVLETKLYLETIKYENSI